MSDFDFQADAGLAALGQGIKGFAQGWQDAEDRKMKRIEMDSKAEAQKSERERNQFLDSMTARDKGFKRDPISGQAVPDVAGRQGEAITKLAPSGLDPAFDDEGNVTGATPNKQLITAKRGRVGDAGNGTTQVAKGKPLAPDKVLLVQQGAQIPTLLGDVEQTLDINKDLFGPFMGRLGQANEYDENSQTVDAQLRTTSQTFGRYMEGGVLKKEDEVKYRKMFPQLSDTPKVAKNKLAIVRKMLVDKQNGDIQALKDQGYDTTGFKFLPPSELPGLLTGKTGLVNKGNGLLDQALPKAVANDGAAPVDPQIKQYADQYGLDYAAAKAIIDKRRAGK